MTATLTPPMTEVHTVADLVLIRYAIPKSSPKAIQKDVGTLLRGDPLSVTEFEEIRDRLASSGLLIKARGKSFKVTDSGLNRVLQLLESEALPESFNWTLVVSRYLFPKATGLSAEAAAKLSTADRLSALILKQKYNLADTAGTTVKQVAEAIVCKELGFPEVTSLVTLMETVLSQLMEADSKLELTNLVKQLPLYGTGLKKAGVADARNKIVRDWLNKPVSSSNDVMPAEPFDLAAFASTVKALAWESRSENRFHDNKAFIAPLWRASQKESNFPQMSLSEFKLKLIEANAGQLLHLSRADQVQEMDQQLLNESETNYLNATFHFVLLEGDRQ